MGPGAILEVLLGMHVSRGVLSPLDSISTEGGLSFQ